MLCCKVFANSNRTLLNLLEHFSTQHGSADTGCTFSTLKIKRTEYDPSGTMMTFTHASVPKTLLQASYQVGYLCKKKPHTLSEELIKPRALEIAKNVLGSEAHRKIQQIPLSNM
jgi:hypothetical protein